MIWVTNSHPVQLAIDVNIKESRIVTREIFAIHVGLCHLSINISDISWAYFRNLIYILHFRNPAPEMLASSMYTLECAVKGKKP